MKRIPVPRAGKALVSGAWLIVSGFALAASEAPPAAALTSIQDIRRLTKEQASSSLPVRVSGTCIYLASGEFFVHDGSHGIWVSSMTSKSRGILQNTSALDKLHVGAAVEVEGISDPGGYARQILPVDIRVTGTAALPEPVEISAEQLVAGGEDGQWVRIEGVVQDVQILADRTVYSLMAEGVSCWFALHGDARKNLPPLVDARVMAVGAFAPDFNNRSEAVLPKIISSKPDCIQIVKPPPADPFDSPRVALNDLRSFSPDGALFHRKVTSGIVTFVRPGEFFYLRDGRTCVRVSSTAGDLRPGWKVDVAGFIDISQHLAALKNGIVRKTGEASLPAPESASAAELLRSASWQSHSQPNPSDLNGHTVTLRGIIRRVDQSSPQRPLAVWLEADNILFPANLPQNVVIPRQTADAWQVGAQARITACCELEFRGKPDPLGLYDPIGFHLWMSSPDDLQIVRPAPWWTPRRLTIALTGIALLALISFGVVAMLRRQVKQKVAIISRELEARAVISERERMAQDLHDTLEQQLTGVAMQLESLAKHPESHPPGFSKRIQLASSMIRHSREEARRSVWDLRNRVLETHGLSAALRSLAESVVIDGGPEVRVDIEGNPADLESTTAYQLLRMAQESIANSLKHSGAKRIDIRLRMSPDQYELTLSDDGRGFDASLANPPGPPHFGLIGMRERASRIGARLTVSSRPGHGCTVHIQLPLQRS